MNRKLPEPGPARWPALVAVLGLTCLVVVVFRPILGYRFMMLDVHEQLFLNPYAHGLTAENLKHIFTTRCVSSYYPVRTFTFALDYQVWGLNPFGFKLTNLLIHLTNVYLVFWLIVRLLRHPTAFDRSPGTWWDAVLAAFPAAVFAIHPVVVEPVTWVAGREELLMTLGALGCIHFHLAARRLSERGGNRWVVLVCHLLAAFGCAAACLSNAVGAVVPALITAWDLLTLGWRQVGKILRGTFALWVLGVLTILIKLSGEAVDAGGDPIDPIGAVSMNRFLVAFDGYWLNIKMLVWPTDLTIDYPMIMPQSIWDPDVILGLVVVGLTGLALWCLRRRIPAIFGLLWFGLALAPTFQIISHHVSRADRFLYLPLVGVAVAMAMILCLTLNVLTGRARVVALAVGILGLLALTFRSADHLQTWRSGEALWTECLRLYPDNGVAHSCLADNLAHDGRLEEAIPHYERALEVGCHDWKTFHNFALRLAISHQHELRDYDRAIQLARIGCRITKWNDPNLRHVLSQAYMNYATFLKEEGQYEKAIKNYVEAIAVDPSYEVPLFNLALLLATCPDEQFREPDKAVRVAEQACAVVGNLDAVQLIILAEVYAETGRLEEAINAVKDAIYLTEAVGMTNLTAEFQERLKQYQQRMASPSSGD